MFLFKPQRQTYKASTKSQVCPWDVQQPRSAIPQQEKSRGGLTVRSVRMGSIELQHSKLSMVGINLTIHQDVQVSATDTTSRRHLISTPS